MVKNVEMVWEIADAGLSQLGYIAERGVIRGWGIVSSEELYYFLPPARDYVIIIHEDLTYTKHSLEGSKLSNMEKLIFKTVVSKVTEFNKTVFKELADREFWLRGMVTNVSLIPVGYLEEKTSSYGYSYVSLADSTKILLLRKVGMLKETQLSGAETTLSKSEKVVLGIVSRKMNSICK